jgi:hypothetical protein
MKRLRLIRAEGFVIPLAVAAALVLLCLGGNANALGRREQSRTNEQSIEVSGRVRLVGNSPMTSLVITAEDREWLIEPEEQHKLMHLQQQLVTVRGSEYYLDRFFANGTFAGRQYYLNNITVIRPAR